MSTINNTSGSTPTRAELSEQYRSQQSEKENLKAEHEREINNLKQTYATEKASLEDRFEQSIQDEKVNHYDQLRNTKVQLGKEERRLEEQRKQIVGTRQSDLNKDQIATESEGTAKINAIKQKFAAAEEYERNRAVAANEEVHTKHRQSAENIIADSNQRLEGMREQKEAELAIKKETHATSLNQIKGHYDGLRTSTETQYAKEFQDLNERASYDLDQRKLASLLVVQNYAERQKDPFYRMNRYESTVQDLGDSYMLRVRVPEYERDQFKVQVSGQEIQINGVRSTNDKVEVEPGRWVSSNSYQNISERMPLDVPVDGRSMSMKANGEWVEYTLPKFGPNRRVNDRFKPSVTADAVRQDEAMTKELEFGRTLQVPTLPAGPSKKTV